MIQKYTSKGNCYSFFLFLFLLSLLVDSGGALGFRNLMLTVVILLTIILFLNTSFKFLKEHLFLIFVCLTLAAWGAFSGTLNNIPIEKTFIFSYFLIAIPVFYIFFKLFTQELIISNMILVGQVFVFSVAFVHIMVLSEFLIPADLIIVFLLKNFDGLFHPKNFFGFDYYVIYFQATLLFTVFSIIFYTQKKYKLYFFSLLLLFVSTSRFGLFVGILVPILIRFLGKRRLSKLTVYFFIFLPLLILLLYVYVYFANSSSWNADPYYGLTSGEARIAHVISTINSFTDIKSVILGQGPGSEFYTLRCNCFVDNTELSQLEFLRKFGLIGYILFHLFLFYVVFRNNSNHLYDLNMFVLTAYVVSVSNPVLTSLIFSALISLSLRCQLIRAFK